MATAVTTVVTASSAVAGTYRTAGTRRCRRGWSCGKVAKASGGCGRQACSPHKFFGPVGDAIDGHALKFHDVVGSEPQAGVQ